MDLDPDVEAKKVKLGLTLAALFIMSTFYSCEELKFATRAKKTEAVFDGIREQSTRRGVSRSVQYHYWDDKNELHHSSAPRPDDFVAPSDGKLAIEYIPDSSRLVGQRNIVPLVMFFGCLLAIGVGLFMFIRHVREATRDTPRRR